MIKFTRDSVVDIDLYEENLRRDLTAYVDTEVLRDSVEIISVEMRSLEQRARKIMRVDSSGMVGNLNKTDIIEFLEDYQYFSPHHFKSRGGSDSLTKDKLRKLYENERQTEFLEAYLKYKDIFDLVSRIRSLYNNYSRDCGDVDNFGRPIERVSMEVNQQQNLRYNYKDYNIVGVPKEYSSAITVPKGKVMVWGDFAQADFRIGYNLLVRSPENQEIMDSVEDKYEGVSRIMADAYKEIFDYVEFKEDRGIYKQNTLATMYGQRGGDTEKARKFVKRFGGYLDNKCPKYQEFCKRIDDRIELGLPINIETYFGNTMTVPIATSGYFADGKGPRNKALNTPFQSGTSEIIILTVNTILDKFYALGYTKDQIGVYFVRHDEPIFIMDKDVMNDSWIFKDCSDILVDDWTPLKADFYFGYNYTIADAELMEAYEENCYLNQNEMHIEEPTPYDGPEFYPISKTMKMAIGHHMTADGNTVVAFYDYDNSRASYVKIGSTDKEVIIEEIEKRFAVYSKTFYAEGYTGAIILNDLRDSESFYDGVYYKYKIQSTKEANIAYLLADHMAYKYNKSKGIETKPSDGVVRNAALIATIKTHDIFKGE
ncbi:hypothetical protein UT300012_23350 [Paraclostridium bifermentans]